jgi:hypothetical protein
MSYNTQILYQPLFSAKDQCLQNSEWFVNDNLSYHMDPILPTDWRQWQQNHNIIRPQNFGYNGFIITSSVFISNQAFSQLVHVLHVFHIITELYLFIIDVFPGRLAGYGISIQQISNTIGSANVSSHTGDIELNGYKMEVYSLSILQL